MFMIMNVLMWWAWHSTIRAPRMEASHTVVVRHYHAR